MSLTCRDCGTDLPYKGRGRPPMRCHGCKRKLSAAKKRAYYEQNKDEIAAKQRAYREQNKDEIAAKQRAYREQNKDEIAAKKRAYYEQNKDEIAAKQRAYREQKLTCSECGERMRHPSDSGLCGFCEEEASVAA